MSTSFQFGFYGGPSGGGGDPALVETKNSRRLWKQETASDLFILEKIVSNLFFLIIREEYSERNVDQKYVGKAGHRWTTKDGYPRTETSVFFFIGLW